jgi:hypothetical protein
VIARAVLATYPFVDASVNQAALQIGAEQKVVDSQSGVTLPALSVVVPEGIYGSIGMQFADGVGPPLFHQTREACATLGLQQSIVGVRFCRVDVQIGRHDIEITG